MPSDCMCGCFKPEMIYPLFWGHALLAIGMGLLSMTSAVWTLLIGFAGYNGWPFGENGSSDFINAL